MALLVCGLTAAPCPYLYGHRQSCPGVTQAVSYEPGFLHSTRRWSRLAGNIRALALPFSTKIPDRAVSHTCVQPIDCLMPNPRQVTRIANWVSGTSEWTESVTAPSQTLLVPAPGCIQRSEPATCLRTPGRPKIYPPLRQGANLRPERKPHL